MSGPQQTYWFDIFLRKRRKMKNLSLRMRIFLSFLVVGMISVGTMGVVVSGWMSSALTESVYTSLSLVREEKKVQIENLFSVMSKQLVTFAANRQTVNATKEFEAAFNELRLPEGIEKSHYSKKNQDFYKSVFTDGYLGINEKMPPNAPNEPESSAAVYLRYQYITQNKYDLGEKHNLLKGDETGWSKIHEELHPSFTKYINEFGYYDLFLVEPNTGYVIYSVYKEIDFATSLSSGPYSNSGLGKVFQEANGGNDGEVFFSDIAKYTPSNDKMAAFIGTPIFDKGVKVGVLILQVPVEKIDQIMTSDSRWDELGYGNSGEVYLVGSDSYMRSQSRTLAQAPSEYIELMKGLNYSESDISYLSHHKRSSGIQKVVNRSVENALKGESGYHLIDDYRGIPVLSAYSSVTLFGKKWAILAEMDQDEALEGVRAMNWILFFIVMGAMVLIGVSSLVVARAISRPVTSSVETLLNTSSEVRSSAEQLSTGSHELSSSSVESAASLEESVAALTSVSEKSRETVSASQSAKELSSMSVQEVTAGLTLVEEMKSVSEELSKDTEYMSQVVSVIEDIAFQTNLLALNAAVEAARAGDQGKGFAVVADAVRSLAGRSGESAKDISDTISRTIEKISKVVDNTDKNVEMFNKIQGHILQIEDRLSSIQVANEDQNQSIENINTAMQQVDSAVQTNAAMSEESAAASQALVNFSSDLDTVGETLYALIHGHAMSQVEYAYEGKHSSVGTGDIQFKKAA
jgi:methyl-accepting chemotaxis protein